jgi:5-methylcytosine-specific restriction endonuclease McrA
MVEDQQLTDEQWLEFIKKEIVDTGLSSFKEIASLTLGHLNPPQVGTCVASKASFQRHYPRRECWAAVKEWFYSQEGKCADCGTRMELQVDHIDPKAVHGDEADRLDNITLRCRRCNVTRRPTHVNGKKTFFTTEAALMWLLLSKKPKTYKEYKGLCRGYGLTMADIRIQEAWAMAKWLSEENRYTIEETKVLDI